MYRSNEFLLSLAKTLRTSLKTNLVNCGKFFLTAYTEKNLPKLKIRIKVILGKDRADILSTGLKKLPMSL